MQISIEINLLISVFYSLSVGRPTTLVQTEKQLLDGRQENKTKKNPTDFGDPLPFPLVSP